MSYTIKVFIAGQPGYYTYEVGDKKEQALDHFANIVRDGYRRVDDRGQLVHYLPRMIDRVVLSGPALSTDYQDTLITT